MFANLFSSLPIFISIIYLFTFFVGKLIQKLYIPYIFAALIFGLIISFVNPFSAAFNSDAFVFMANTGLFFLLFLIGFELDIQKLKKMGGFVIKSSFFVIGTEVFFMSIFLHFVFHLEFLLSVLLAMSFATVGEGILIPILDEFNMLKTRLGTAIIGISTFDDIFEITSIVALIIIAPFLSKGSNLTSLLPEVLFSVVALLVLSGAFLLFKKQIRNIEMKVPDIPALVLFSLAVFFLFVGIGEGAKAGAIGALLAGVVLKQTLKDHYLVKVEEFLKIFIYGFLAPIFFTWVGGETKINLRDLGLIVAVIIVAKSSKLLASYIVGRKELGSRQSIVMGVALSVRFSTSLIVLTLLYQTLHLISGNLYSVLIGTSIAFKFIVPFLLAFLVRRWHFEG